jgi:hypothetical protein
VNKQSKQADKFQLYNIPQHWIDIELRKKNLLIQLNSGQKNLHVLRVMQGQKVIIYITESE